MQIIRFKAGEHEFKIYVPCQDRARCYLNELRQVAFRLMLFLQVNQITTRYQYTVPGLLESLASILDREVMGYIEQDLETYREEKDLNGGHLTAEQAEEYLSAYYAARDYHQGSCAQHLRNECPAMHRLLSVVSKNFRESIVEVWERIESDFAVIYDGFLSDTMSLEAADQLEQINLTKISCTGSDFHKSGRQVLILTFSYAGASVSVVYKPSSVMADAMLVGDVKRLQTLNSDFTGKSSFLEIINRFLSSPLLTYLIIPRGDDPTDFTAHYGYMEYLTHEPWPSLNYDAILDSVTRDIAPSERGMSLEPQKQVNKLFTDCLRRASKVDDCDFIARNQEDIERYSFECGVLSAFVLLGMGDFHLENLIVSKKRPVMLDLEICFNPEIIAMDPTLAFDGRIGALSHKSFSYVKAHCLNDISGMTEQYLHHVEKNRYYLYVEDDNQLVACPPQRDMYLIGLRETLSILFDQRAHFEEWFQDEAVRTLCVRVLPFATIEFTNTIDVFRREGFSKASYVNHCQTAFEAGNEGFSRPSPKDDPLDQKLGSPGHVIYYRPECKMALYNEFASLNVPVYYTNISEGILYDCHGDPVIFPEQAVRESQDGSEPQGLTDQFFEMPLHTFIFERFVDVTSDPNCVKALEARLTKEYDEAFEGVRSSRYDGVLPRVNLNPTERGGRQRQPADDVAETQPRRWNCVVS